jgi:hypothetical protein
VTTFSICLLAYTAIACALLIGWLAFGSPMRPGEVFGVVAFSIAWLPVLAAFAVVAVVEILLGDWRVP